MNVLGDLDLLWSHVQKMLVYGVMELVNCRFKLLNLKSGHYLFMDVLLKPIQFSENITKYSENLEH
jgi:hypothetical protein